MEDKKISEHFNISEFEYVNPDPILLEILEFIRKETGKPIKITSSKREVIEHINVYKKLYKMDWIKKIAWDSKHLPTFKTPFLRAVDFVCEGKTGKELKALALKARDSIKDSKKHVGIGIGSTFIHLDIDREADVFWTYNY